MPDCLSGSPVFTICILLWIENNKNAFGLPEDLPLPDDRWLFLRLDEFRAEMGIPFSLYGITCERMELERRLTTQNNRHNELHRMLSSNLIHLHSSMLYADIFPKKGSKSKFLTNKKSSSFSVHLFFVSFLNGWSYKFPVGLNWKISSCSFHTS